MDHSGVMSVMKLANVGLVSLAAVLATGCYGKAGPDGALFVGGIITGAIMSAAHNHAEEERELARESERDEEPFYPRVSVVYDRDGVGTPALPPAPPAPPPPIAFNAEAVRNALAAVDLGACRAAGAPRGYGHAKATVTRSGDISKVVVDAPAGMPPAAAQCIGDAIGRVTVPEFGGTYVTVGTTYFVP